MSSYGPGYPPPPGSMGQAPGQMSPPPPNYLVWAILVTIFCCLPLGIPAIVFAAQVNSKWQIGDVAGAQESSQRAKQFSLWGAIIGVVLIVVYTIYVVTVAGSILSV